MVKTLTIPLVFNATNQATYNIQGGQLEKVKKIIVRQITSYSASGATPPVPICAIYSDLMTPEQSFGSICIEAETASTIAPMCELEPQNHIVSGNHVFTLSFGPGTNYVWSIVDITVLLTLSFE